MYIFLISNDFKNQRYIGYAVSITDFMSSCFPVIDYVRESEISRFLGRFILVSVNHKKKGQTIGPAIEFGILSTC
jgi:hypothetical protein